MTASNEQLLAVRLEASLAKFEKQLKRGYTVADKMSNDTEQRFARMGRSVQGSSAAAARGMSRFFNVSRGGRFVLQNTAAQIGDIAVQLESGTGAMRVMGQQVPQILGGFGALSGTLGILAPLLGTVAAVGFPIAAMLLATGKNAETSSEKVKTFADKLRDAEGAIRDAASAARLSSGSGMEDLREIYGALTVEVTELSRALAEVERRAAVQQLQNLFDTSKFANLGALASEAIGGEAGQLFQIGVEVDQEAIDLARRQVAEMQTEILNLNELNQAIPAALAQNFLQAKEELSFLEGRLSEAASLTDKMGPSAEVLARVRDLQTAYEQALSEENFIGAADAMRDILRISEDLGWDLGEAREQMLAVEDLARRFGFSLGDAASSATDVADASSGIAPQIDAATASASELVGMLNAAMGALAGVVAGIADAQRKARAEISIKAATVGKPTERAGLLARNEMFEQLGANPDLFDPRNENSAEISRAADGIQAEAESIAAARESLSAAEKAFSESLRESRKRSGGGASRDQKAFYASAEKEASALQRRIGLLGKSSSEIAELTTKHRLLEAAKRAGLELDSASAIQGKTVGQVIDDQAAAVGRLTEELKRGQKSQQQFEAGMQEISRSMARAILDGNGFRDSMARVFDKIAEDILTSQIHNLIGSLFKGVGGGGGFFSGLFSSILGFSDGGPVQKFASGGYVTGPGGPRADLVPAMLSNGEYVMNAEATKRHKPLLDALNFGMAAKYASGGMVGASAPSGVVASPGEINLTVEVHTQSDQPQEVAGETAAAVRSAMVSVFQQQLGQSMRPGGVIDTRYQRKAGA